MSRLDRIENWHILAEASKYKSQNLAAILRVSASQLRRYFATHFDQSPQKWLNQQRLKRAVALIQASQMSMKEVAHDLMFSSPSAFTHQFRRYLSCAPQDLLVGRGELGGIDSEQMRETNKRCAFLSSD